MAKKEIKAYKCFVKFAQLTLGSYLRWSYRIKYQNVGEVRKLKGSYVLLGNHTNLWDPFMMGTPIPRPVHFVTSDEYFRHPILKILLSWVGAIPKKKFVSDAETVKDVLKIRNKDGIIGIFPEGARNWDGKTLEILFPTAKLVKSLKVPVVTALFEGGALSFPRWARKARRGKMFITYKVLLTAEEVINLSVEEVYERMCKALAHDEYVFQKKMMIPYKGQALAEHLELFLFACPHCQQLGMMHSEGDQFKCTNCQYGVQYTEYGYFEALSPQIYFNNPQDWNFWQLDHFRQMIEKYKVDAETKNPLIVENNLLVLKGSKSEPLDHFTKGQLELYADHLVLTSTENGQETVFPLQELHGINIQYSDRFEFYYDKFLYRFRFEGKIVSAYQWVTAMRMLQANSDEKVMVNV